MITRIAAILSLAFILTSCKKDDDPDITPPVQDGGVYIMNEGNFNWGNGSIDYYRFADGSLNENIFETVNDRPLGDVVQSMTIYDGRAYIVVNNSGKVEVVNMSDFSSAGTITGFTSPRYLISVSVDKAYVSDLYSNSISLVDINTMQVTGHIPLKGSSEEMLLVGNGKVWVTNTRSSYIYIVDVASAAVIDSIAVGYASHCIRWDLTGMVWVLCAGDAAQSINAGLYRLHPFTDSVMAFYDLGVPLNIWDKMALNENLNEIYYLNNGLWKMSITAGSLPSAPMISEGSNNFYGLGVDPQSGDIYLSDALDYVQKGRVYRYSKDGVLINSFAAGIIPSGFYFH